MISRLIELIAENTKSWSFCFTVDYSTKIFHSRLITSTSRLRRLQRLFSNLILNSFLILFQCFWFSFLHVFFVYIKRDIVPNICDM